MATILLKGGVALIHDAEDRVTPQKTDILIRGNKIEKVQESIPAPSDAEIVDCSSKIISPGFLSTHHHVWQTQLKGRHADETLLEYMATGNVQGFNYDHGDIFWGQLAGCLEALDAGTTMVVDHAHMNYTPESSKYAISATVSSGIRAIFGYSPIVRVDSFNPLTMNQNIFEPWVMETLEELAGAAPFGENGRVQLGLAFDGYFLPKEQLLPFFDRVRALGIDLITSHYERIGAQSRLSQLDALGILNASMLLSHASGIDPDDAALIARRHAHVSCTPSTELQMGMGAPVCWDERVRAVQPQCSLGIDCHSNNAASVPGEMRLGLQAARGMANQALVDRGLTPRRVFSSVEAAFNLGTIQGARAVRMEGQLGSIVEGKLADLVLFDAVSPSMACAAQQDPVAAVVLHSSPADIRDVIVDGRFRKRDGALLPVQIDGYAKSSSVVAGAENPVAWRTVVTELLKSREAIQGKIDKLDLDDAKKVLKGVFQVDESKLVDF